MRLDDIFNYVVSCIRSGDCDTTDHSEIKMQCPGCRDEDHFSVNKNGKFNCFKCPIGGNLSQQISKRLSEWKKLVRVVSDTPSSFYSEPRPICSLDRNTIYDIIQGIVPGKPQSLLQKQAYRSMMYCLERGMTRKQVCKYKVFIKPYDSRIYFPYWNDAGDTVFTMGRTTSVNIEPKTLEEGDAVKPLFGRHVQIHRNKVILVEGVFDHFATIFSYAVMGSTVVNQQINQLTQDGIKQVFLMFDPEAGEEMERSKVKLVKNHFNVYPIILNSRNDPAELGREVITNVINIAIHNCPARPQSIYFTV